MNEELKTYWQYLRDNNADVPDTFESFHRTLQDDVSAKKYYDYLKSEGFDAPETFESFSSTLGLKKKDSIGGFTTPSPLLSQEPTPGPKDYLSQLTYKPEEEPVVGTIPVVKTDPSEQRAEKFFKENGIEYKPQDLGRQDQTNKPVFESQKEELKHELKQFEGSVSRIASGDFTEKDIEILDAYQSKFPDKNKQNRLVETAKTIATKKKEYDDLFTQKEAEFKESVESFQNKRLAELQKLVKTSSDADKYNKILKEETEAFITQKEAEFNKELEPKFKEFLKSMNTPFADANYRKGYQDTMNREVSGLEKLVTGEYLDKVIPGETFTDFRKSLVSTMTDQLPVGVASGVAGTMTVDFDEYIVAQHSTFNKGDYWDPEKALENRKKVEREKYIKKVGKEQYEKEKKEWESKRLEEKQGLMNYSTRQEGEGEASSPHLTWEDAKLQGKKLNYVGKNVGQVLGLAAPTVVASAINPNLGAAVGFAGMSLMEKGEAYKEGLSLIEQRTGLSQEEIFKTNADNLLRDSSTRSGLINGLLEYIGQVATVGKFMPKNQLVNLLDKVVKNRAAKVTIGSLTEGLTEWMQSKDTHYAAAIGDGKSHEEALQYALEQDDTESFIAGLSGGGVLSGVSQIKDYISEKANAINNPSIDDLLKTGPSGKLEDVESLTSKLKGNEKPKEPSKPVAAAEVPEVKTEESVPVQSEQEKQSKERKKILINTLLDTDDVDHSFKTAGYTNKEGFWVEPGAENQFGQLSEETKAILKKNGIVFIGNSSDRKDISGAAGGLKVYEGGKPKTIRGIYLTDHGENYAGHDKVAVHEAAHSVWSDLDKATQDLFNDGNPITEHGKEYKKGGERYKSVYGENQDQLGEEDFAELFALNRGDLEKTIQDKINQQQDAISQSKSEKVPVLVTSTEKANEIIVQNKIEGKLFTEKESSDDIIRKARQGDKNAQERLTEYGLEWDEKPKYRIIGQKELEALETNGEVRSSRGTGHNKTDITDDPNYDKVGGGEGTYRIKFKDTDKFDSKMSSTKTTVKNKEEGEYLLDGPYTKDDIEYIEELKEDANGNKRWVRVDLKQKQDAVQERSPKTLPVEKPTTVSPQVGEEVSGEEKTAGETEQEEVTYIKQELDGRVLYEDIDGNKYEARPTRGKKTDYDIYKNGKKLDQGAKKFADIADVIKLHRESEENIKGIDITVSDKTDYSKVPTEELKSNLEKETDFNKMAAMKKELDSRVYVPKDGWKFNIIKAREYAQALGLDFKGKELDDIVFQIKDFLKKTEPEVKPNIPIERAELGMPIKEETFGKFKVIGVNSEGNKVGEDKNGVRGVLKGTVIVSQPVGIIPGQGISVSSPEGQFLTKEESKSQADKIAKDNGFDNASHLLNSVKKRTGEEYENVQDIPKEVIKQTVQSRENEGKQIAITDQAREGQFVESSDGYVYKITKVLGDRRFKIQDKDGNEATINSDMFDIYTTDKTFEEKPKITQIKEANPDRILVVKPTSDKPKPVKGDILTDSKTGKTATVTRVFKPQKGSAQENEPFLVDIQFEDGKKAMNMPMSRFTQEQKDRKSDAKFEKARKSAAELLDLIGPGLKIDEKYDSEKGQKIIIKAGEVVANYIDAGVTRFAEMLQDIYETYGEKGLRMMFEPMKKGYGSQMASVGDDVLGRMDDLKTVRGTKIEDILNQQYEQTGTTTPEPGGGTGSGVNINNEPQPQERTEQRKPAGSQKTTGVTDKELSGSEGDLRETGDDTSGSPQGGDTGRIRPELADADVQHNFVYPDNWERNKNKTFSKRQAYKDNIAALEVISSLLDNPELFATDAQKEILSRYNGLGPLGEILLSDNKGPDWSKTNLEFFEDSQRLKELLKEIGEKTNTNPLKTAKESSLNAYYTSIPVIRSIWDGLTSGNFTGGRILEGSMGSGRFIGGMPPHVMSASRIKGVDLDVVSSLISRYLYPKVSVSNTGLQQASVPSNYYDLFISNIPFGTNKVYDPQIDKKGPLWKESQSKIHTYFFAKAIDSVRPGGYIAILTSANVLDSQSNQGIRDLINQETDFIGAVRLSSDAFNADAGTQVVTDIVLLRKKVDKSAPSTNEDINTISTKRVPHKDRNRPEQAIKYNEYFQRHPDHVFGEEWEAGGLYSADSGYTLKGEIDTQALTKKLQELASEFPIVEQKENTEDIQKVLQISPLGRMVSGGIVEQKGEYFKVQDFDQQTGKFTIEQIKKTVMPSAKDMPILESFVKTKNIYFDVLAKDKQGIDTKNERAELKKAIDVFVKSIKPSTLASIGSGNKAISRMLVSDPDFYAITSLVKDDGTYSDVVDKPIKTDLVEFTETNNPQEAIGYSINTYGRINLPFIQKVMGAKTEQEAIDKIQAEIFETPDGEVIEKTEYLSGNVVEKLKQAQQWAKADKKYEKNVAELEKVIPEPVEKDQIKFQLGASWIPVTYTQQFLDSIFGPGMVTIRYNKATDDYDVETRVVGGEYEAQDDEGNRRGVEVVIKAALTKNVPIFTKIVDEQTIPLPKLTQDVRDKAERLQDEFEGLIQADQQTGDELAKLYNELFNGIVIKKNDGSKLTFPGMQHFTMGAHQKDAVALMIHRMGGMVDHIVGGGKSLIMGAGAIKMKQLGLVNKPMITTMKSVIPGLLQDVKKAYPSAKILSPKDTDFSASNRQRLFAQIANNEWDLIIISHENLGTIPLPSDFETEYINNELEELESAIREMSGDKNDKWAVKQAKALEKRKLDLQARLQELQDKGKYASRTDFGVMGIDFLMVDESQQFKNLSFITKLRGTAGLGNPKGSKRASNLKMVSRYLQKMHGGDKGVVFASGTPISNSLVELYNIFQYLRPSILKKLQMNSLDQFIKNFAMITSLMEKNVAGVIKNKTRLTKFVNVTELASLYSEVSDIRGVHNLKLPRPDIKGGKPEIILIPQSDTQKMITGAIYDASKMGDVGPLKDIGINPKGDAKKALGLVLTTLGTKASIDPRMVFPGTRADGGKVPIVADKVKKIFDDTKKDKGVQLVFADMGTPKNKNAPLGERVRDQIIEMHGEDFIEEISGLESVFKLKDEAQIREKLIELMEIDSEEASEIIFNANDVNSFNVYGELKNQLTRMGIPSEQIAFIHDAPTKKLKEELFAKVNSGDIRVLVGSTMKMGTGVNVQRRVVAMHHIDVGWRPSDLEQRNGRGIRRGNMNKEVEIYYYGTMETIDAYRFGLLAKKQSGIDSFRAGANGVREMEFEDGESMTMSEFEAAISGDTRILDLEKLKAKAYKLKNRVDSVKRANALRERRIRDSKDFLERQRLQRDITKEVGEQLAKGTRIEELEDEVEVDGKVKKQKGNVAIFKGDVDGKEYDTIDPKQRKEFYERLAKNINSSKYSGTRVEIGSVAGVPLYAQSSEISSGSAKVTIGEKTWGRDFAPEVIKKASVINQVSVRIAVTATIRDFNAEIESTQRLYEQALVASKQAEQIPTVEVKQKDVDDLAETEAKRKALSDELKAEAKKNEPGYQEPEEETPNKPLSDIIKDISDLGADQYKDISGMAMTSFIPGLKPKGKVRVKPNNNRLTDHVVSKNAQATPEQQLQEAIQFNDQEVQKRFDESRVWTSQNMESFFSTIKDWAKGFSQHFKYLNAKVFPREANIIREFETLNKWAKGEATRYMKGLVSPLTPEQYTILSNRIILSDLLGSINRGENMTGIDGKYPFGLSSVQEIEAEFAKYDELMKVDPVIEKAFEARENFMGAFKQELISSGLLEENDIDDYYHRRVLEYQNDSLNENILFGKTIGDKKRSFQKRRTGTRGMDYNTNFIETEFKVVSEGLFELEKQKILKDLMAPYEVQLKELEKEFKKGYDKKMKELEDQYGPDSEEVKIHNDSKRALKRNYLNENIPDGYVFWRVSEENRLFWGKTVTQKVIDNALMAAEANDQSGMSDAMKVVDDLVGSIQMGLMVGAKRKQYMVPKELAQQLEEMAKDKELSVGGKIVNNITSIWKRHTLLFPTRIIRYNLNNLGGDLDRTLQVEPAILKYAKESFKELYDYYKTGKTTDLLLEAMRGDVISSGFQISELADLRKEDWVKWVESKSDLTVEKVMGKEWVKANAIALSSKPADLYNKYMDAATRVIELREAVLRYAAYKLADEKIKKGQTFYWASDPKQIDRIPDQRQKKAKLSREVYGDYSDISITGQELRRNLLPFYSWAEINMKTHWQLIKNASSPEVQRRMIAVGLAKGIPKVAVKMAWAYTKLALFSAAIQAWNYAKFGPDDDDDDSAMAKLRRSTIKGLQVIVDVDPETGFIKTLPIQGTFYDFLDFMGIPNAWSDVSDLIEQDKPVEATQLFEIPQNMVGQTANRTSQMITPFAKMMFELPAKVKYFPDVWNPIPFRDRWEYVAETVALKDEYNYIFSDAPKKENYWKRKWNNSLFLREFDTELLAYYATKKIISEYKGGATGYEPGKNKVDQDKSKAAYYYSLSKRYGNTEEADKYLNQFIELEIKAIGQEFTSTGSGTAAALSKLLLGTGNNPTNGLNVPETNDLVKLMADPNYEPLTAFGKSLTPREIAIIKDGTRFYNRISGFEGPNALFIKK